MIPVRCWSCGKCICHLWPLYQAELQEAYLKVPVVDRVDNPVKLPEKGGIEKTIEGQLLDKYGVSRVCCRKMFLGVVDMLVYV